MRGSGLGTRTLGRPPPWHPAHGGFISGWRSQRRPRLQRGSGSPGGFCPGWRQQPGPWPRWVGAVLHTESTALRGDTMGQPPMVQPHHPRLHGDPVPPSPLRQPGVQNWELLYSHARAPCRGGPSPVGDRGILGEQPGLYPHPCGCGQCLSPTGRVSVQRHPAQASRPEIPQELVGSGRVVEHCHVDIPWRRGRWVWKEASVEPGAALGSPKAWPPRPAPQRSPPEHSPVPVSTFTFCVLPWARATRLSTGSMLSQASASP